MPKIIHQALSAPAVKYAKPGRHADGGGLFLLVKASGSRSWLYRYKLDGRERDMGLGSAGPGGVTLADARLEAVKAKALVKAGLDPLALRVSEAAKNAADAQAKRVQAITFKTVAASFLAANEAGWRNAKHRYQWGATLESYVYPHMGDLPVAEVSTAHVMAALEPIWTVKPETASRVRGRIETILDYAKARDWRSGENPARWRGHVANLLPKRSKVARVQHHPALPWAQVGGFTEDLRKRTATAARALEFTILTAARTGEVIGARWSEIDRKSSVWSVPGERMKMGKEHRVPLPAAATSILDEMELGRPAGDKKGAGFLFPGGSANTPLSSMAMLMLLRRMGRADLTVHGFRSTFRDWCAESTAYPHEMAEIALAHAVGDKVEAAYRRGDMIEKRRRMMDDWAEFCSRTLAEEVNVRPIRVSA